MGFSELCNKSELRTCELRWACGTVWNVAFSFVLLTLFMSGWATNRHKYSRGLRVPFLCVFAGGSVRRGTRINSARAHDWFKLCWPRAYVFLRIALFFKKGLRPYLRPFRPKWLGRAFSFVTCIPPGLLVSASLCSWAPARSGCHLIAFFCLGGQDAQVRPRVLTCTAHSHPSEGGAACHGAPRTSCFPQALTVASLLLGVSWTSGTEREVAKLPWHCPFQQCSMHLAKFNEREGGRERAGEGARAGGRGGGEEGERDRARGRGERGRRAAH